MINKYRLNSIVVEAVQYDGTNFAEISNWLNGETVVVDHRVCLILERIDDQVMVDIGDYIVRVVEGGFAEGEFYVITPSTFEENYEMVE